MSSANDRALAKYLFIQRVLADPGLSSTAKCIVTALLLKWHNGKTGQCNPGLGKIAEAVGLTRRAIIAAVAELKRSGWVEIISTSGGSPSNTNRYKFDFAVQPGSAPTSEENCTGTGDEDFTSATTTSPVKKMSRPVKQTSHEPFKNPSPLRGEGDGGETAPRRRAADAAPPEEEGAFGEFWRQYPKREGQDGARRAFNEVVGKGADPQAIIQGAMRYAAERTDKPERYTAMAANWLRDGRWKDKPSKPDDVKDGGQHRRGKPNPVEEMLRAGGHDGGRRRS
jgi:hypothetical protein